MNKSTKYHHFHSSNDFKNEEIVVSELHKP